MPSAPYGADAREAIGLLLGYGRPLTPYEFADHISVCIRHLSYDQNATPPHTGPANPVENHPTIADKLRTMVVDEMLRRMSAEADEVFGPGGSDCSDFPYAYGDETA